MDGNVFVPLNRYSFFEKLSDNSSNNTFPLALITGMVSMIPIKTAINHSVKTSF